MEGEKIKEIEEKILKIAIEIIREGNGALFVVGNKVEYERLLKQKFEPFSIFDDGAEKLIKGLAIIDGAILIDKNGMVKEYGAMIKKTKAFVGYGTRHAAAFSASANNNMAVLCSEEEKKIKIFKNGKYIMQIDALDKNIERNVSKITNILEVVGAGFLGTFGVGALAPSLGLTLIPGVLIFGGSYYAFKSIFERFNKK